METQCESSSISMRAFMGQQMQRDCSMVVDDDDSILAFCFNDSASKGDVAALLAGCYDLEEDVDFSLITDETSCAVLAAFRGPRLATIVRRELEADGCGCLVGLSSVRSLKQAEPVDLAKLQALRRQVEDLHQASHQDIDPNMSPRSDSRHGCEQRFSERQSWSAEHPVVERVQVVDDETAASAGNEHERKPKSRAVVAALEARKTYQSSNSSDHSEEEDSHEESIQRPCTSDSGENQKSPTFRKRRGAKKSKNDHASKSIGSVSFVASRQGKSDSVKELKKKQCSSSASAPSLLRHASRQKLRPEWDSSFSTDRFDEMCKHPSQRRYFEPLFKRPMYTLMKCPERLHTPLYEVSSSASTRAPGTPNTSFSSQISRPGSRSTHIDWRSCGSSVSSTSFCDEDMEFRNGKFPSGFRPRRQRSGCRMSRLHCVQMEAASSCSDEEETSSSTEDDDVDEEENDAEERAEKAEIDAGRARRSTDRGGFLHAESLGRDRRSSHRSGTRLTSGGRRAEGRRSGGFDPIWQAAPFYNDRLHPFLGHFFDLDGLEFSYRTVKRPGVPLHPPWMPETPSKKQVGCGRHSPPRHGATWSGGDRGFFESSRTSTPAFLRKSSSSSTPLTPQRLREGSGRKMTSSVSVEALDE